MRSKRFAPVLAATCVALAVSLTQAEQSSRRFMPDDPVAVDHDAALDAGAARRDSLGAYADFVLNSFMPPGDRRAIPAMNVNTVGEVPDSSWFTNRIGARALSLEEIVRGPDRVDALTIDDWVIVQGKDTGRQAGFRAVSASDPTRQLYQIEFDPRAQPEMATGAEIIGTAIYHAIGYNVVDTYLIDLDVSRLTIAPDATIETGGRARRFTRRDLADILRRSARNADGRYRATASRFAEGRPLGPFRYYGTRPDDPNDIYPHEHRRELRGNRVFCAWLNHDDSRAVNSLDMLIGTPGRQHVKHYMFDFGSILGSGTNDPDHPWVGHEYVVEGRNGLLTLASFGLWRRPYLSVDAPSDLRGAGNFTADRFDPVRWRPHYRNAAFENMQPEDAFWAARIVAAFTPDAIAAIVRKARFSDPRTTDHMIGTLLQRREHVLRAWLSNANPVANLRLEGSSLVFDNAAAHAGLSDAVASYETRWFTFDNEQDRRTAAGPTLVTNATRVEIPNAIAGTRASYVGVEIQTIHPGYPQWRSPVTAFFRAQANGTWQVVGIDRAADAVPLYRAAR